MTGWFNFERVAPYASAANACGSGSCGMTGQTPESLQEQERMRLHDELGQDLPALALQLPMAEKGIWLRRWRDADDPLFHPRAPIDGNSILKTLEIKPGPLLGRLLHHLKLEHAFGRIRPHQRLLRKPNVS